MCLIFNVQVDPMQTCYYTVFPSFSLSSFFGVKSVYKMRWMLMINIQCVYLHNQSAFDETHAWSCLMTKISSKMCLLTKISLWI